MTSFPQLGAGATSYAGALAICLRACGAPDEIADPSLLECLTTMPFGRTYIVADENSTGVFVPSGWSIDPHGGIDQALKSAGWSATEWNGDASTTDDEALAYLTKALEFGPVLLGPMSLGELPHPPYIVPDAVGKDLFVVASIDGDSLTIEDPAGYSYDILEPATLLSAWRAESIDYKRGQFTLRARFELTESVTRQTSIARAIPRIRAKLTIDPGGRRVWGENGPLVYGGADALSRLARDLRDGISDAQVDWLLEALQLAAQRSFSASWFLREAIKPKASANMGRQAELFGGAAADIGDTRLDSAAAKIDELALLEADLHGSLA